VTTRGLAAVKVLVTLAPEPVQPTLGHMSDKVAEDNQLPNGDLTCSTEIV
jgi:hypothetical protein